MSKVTVSLQVKGLEFWEVSGQVGVIGEIQIGGEEADGDRGTVREATLLSTGCREHPRQPRIKTAILTFQRKPSSPYTPALPHFISVS